MTADTVQTSLQSLMAVDDHDEQLYAMVNNAKAITKAARIARIATREYMETLEELNRKSGAKDQAMQRLTDLILATK
jgi:hypothetical protein